MSPVPMQDDEFRGVGVLRSSHFVLEYGLSFSEGSPTTDAMSSLSRVSTQVATLTSREDEVANLVARGLTNRQIASVLMLSEHTVATHVRRTLKKLGLRSRAQIGSWLSEQQGSAQT